MYLARAGEERTVQRLPGGSMPVSLPCTGYHVRWLHFSCAVTLLCLAAPLANGQDAPPSDTVRAAPQPMAPVVVTASRGGPYWLLGFYQRRQRSVGYFLTRDQIARHDDVRLTDLLRARVPAVQVGSSGMGQSRLRLRGQRCAPMVWIDGGSTPAGEFDLDILQVSTIAAIEIYPGGATAPVEFRTGFGRDACGGVIVIWSRVGLDDSEREEAESDAPVAAEGPAIPVFRWDEVDEPAQVDSTAAVAPAYPDSLAAFSISGSVIATVVIDTTGLPVTGSIGIITTSSPAFGEAVRHALSESRFLPARKGGRLVRQVLVVPYTFTARDD